MPRDHLAIASTTVLASAADVWTAITDPAAIATFMLETTVTSDWKVGSVITFTATHGGIEYRDHGRILDVRPGELLRMTHFSPRGRREDIPENYHTLTWTLEPEGDHTRVTLTQDNNESEDAAERSEAHWSTVLVGLTKYVEAG